MSRILSAKSISGIVAVFALIFGALIFGALLFAQQAPQGQAQGAAAEDAERPMPAVAVEGAPMPNPRS